MLNFNKQRDKYLKDYRSYLQKNSEANNQTADL